MVLEEKNPNVNTGETIWFNSVQEDPRDGGATKPMCQ